MILIQFRLPQISWFTLQSLKCFSSVPNRCPIVGAWVIISVPDLGKFSTIISSSIFSWSFFCLLLLVFIIARTWKKPRCPSADEWIRNLWYIYTMEYYSAIKKNTIESVLIRWMKLEPIIQSEVSQKEKHQYSILMHIYGI